MVYGRHKLHFNRMKITQQQCQQKHKGNRFQIDLMNYIAIKTINETKAAGASVQDSLLLGVESLGDVTGEAVHVLGHLHLAAEPRCVDRRQAFLRQDLKLRGLGPVVSE